MLPIIDRVGRRQLLLGGAVTCMTLHFATAGVMATYGRPVPEVFGNANLRLELDPTPGKAVIALSYIFTGIYGLTWAPTGWIYCSEVFPLKYRAKGVGLSAATNWYVSSSPLSSSSSLSSIHQIPIYKPMLITNVKRAFNFALAYFLPPAFKNITWKTYIIFGIFCFVMTFHIFFTYPETARKTLEEIDLLFDSKIPAWKSAGVKSNSLETRAAEIEKGSVNDDIDDDDVVERTRGRDGEKRQVVRQVEHA